MNAVQQSLPSTESSKSQNEWTHGQMQVIIYPLTLLWGIHLNKPIESSERIPRGMILPECGLNSHLPKLWQGVIIYLDSLSLSSDFQDL